MSDFKAKMHQIRFRLGLRPRPRWGAYSAPQTPLAGFEGPTSKGGEGWGWAERGGDGGEGRGEEAFCLKSAPEPQMCYVNDCIAIVS